MEEILNWAGKGEDDMAFKYNIIKAFEDERAEGKAEGEAIGEARGRAEGEAIGEARGRTEGEAIGEARGRVQGELLKVVSQVRKKVARNMSVEEITDMLEEDIKLVVRICDALEKYPEWSDEQISKLL